MRKSELKRALNSYSHVKELVKLEEARCLTGR